MQVRGKQSTVAARATEDIQPCLDHLVLEGARHVIHQTLQEEIQVLMGREYCQLILTRLLTLTL